MKTFQIWYSEGEYGKAWFTARDLQHAEELLRQIDAGELSPKALPDFEYNVKGGDGWEWSDLEEFN
ncbi:MAG: hypothetical protein EBS38_02555 [Actinobacteria bacterium]|nr:hypothetical protein [Actinomycetota bacterium]